MAHSRFPASLAPLTAIRKSQSKGLDRLTECKELLFRLSPQLDENVPVSSTASSKTTHDLFEFLREVSGLALELGRPLATLLGDVVDEC